MKNQEQISEEMFSVKQIISYILLTFIITWGLHGIVILGNQFGFISYGSVTYWLCFGFGGWGPPIAIIILMIRWKKFRSIKDFGHYLFKNSGKNKTLIVIVVSCVMQFLITILLNQKLDDTPLYMLFAYWPFMAVCGGGLEELGWRGFLQPQLEKRIPYIPATLIVGSVWACWHIPQWFMDGTSYKTSNISFFSFYVACIASAFVFSAIYKCSHSVFACILFHGLFNSLFSLYSNFMVNPDLTAVILYCVEIALAIVVWYYKPRNKKEAS